MGGHPALGRARGRAVDRRRHRVGRRRRPRRALRAAPRLEHRPARRRDPVLDRRRGRVLGAAPGAAPPPDHRDARGRVRLQRRPRRHPRRRRSPPQRPTPRSADVVVRWRSRRSSSSASVPPSGSPSAGRVASSCAGPRPAPRACSASGWSPSPSSRMPRRPACTPAASSPATSRPWCWATCGCPHGPAVLGFVHRAGLARPDRAVRAARAARLAEPDGRPDRPAPSSSAWCCCSSPDRCRCSCRSSPFRLGWRDQVFLSWAGLRGAVPVVLATVPLTVGRPNVELDLRAGLRPRRDLHHRPGADPAVGGPAARASSRTTAASTCPWRPRPWRSCGPS